MSALKEHEGRLRRIRSVSMALGSFLFLGLIAIALIAPTRVVFAASFQGSSTGIPGHGIVYGKVVTSGNKGLGDVQAVLLHRVIVNKRKVLKVAYTTHTNAQGVYRIAFKETKPTLWWEQLIMSTPTAKVSAHELVKSNFGRIERQARPCVQG